MLKKAYLFLIFEIIFQCFAKNKAGVNEHTTFVEIGASSSNADDYDFLDSQKSYEGYVVTNPTRPNISQISADSVVLTWKLETSIGNSDPIVPVKFFKIQFREFFRGRNRSQWHTLGK